MILILDFGSQTTHLISRRLRDLGIETEIVDPEISIQQIKKIEPAGLILSGGPSSVYLKNAPTVEREIFSLGIPILGICYGWQLMAQLLGGKVVGGQKEYGPQILKLVQDDVGGKQSFSSNKLFTGLPKVSTVWVSHGDTVIKLPPDFISFGSTENVQYAAAADLEKRIFGVQFHPEVDHTVYGKEILRNFAQKICRLKIKKKRFSIQKIIDQIRKQVGKTKVVGAISGGTESTIASLLCIKAIGKNFIPVYIHSGLMRDGTKEFVQKVFPQFAVQPRIVDASGVFLKELQKIVDPEQKRVIVGNLYYQLIKKEVGKIKGTKFFLQGTVYSDIIESQGTKRADKIKSHHNVAGLPAELGLKLLEPLREFYTDEVREIGEKLKLPSEIIYRQPFPGPGHAVRILGEVTPQRLEKQQRADKIVLAELEKAGWLNKVFQSFSVLTGAQSTAVKGDARILAEVVALRIYISKDRMTADWAKLPYDLLQKISSRIVNEVPGVSRVVYDITTKPPATMEWE